jgi:hypothetical protein
MLTTLRLPVDWNGLGFPDPFSVGRVTVASGNRGWAWTGAVPDLGVSEVPNVTGAAVPGWGVDHIVLLVPDLDDTVAVIETAAHPVRKRVEVKGRRTAFFLVGPLLEVIEESSVDRPLLWGIALETATPLSDLAARWRSTGHEVTDPRPAFQEGREIITVGSIKAGVAVMTPRSVETKAG